MKSIINVRFPLSISILDCLTLCIRQCLDVLSKLILNIDENFLEHDEDIYYQIPFNEPFNHFSKDKRAIGGRNIKIA